MEEGPKQKAQRLAAEKHAKMKIPDIPHIVCNNCRRKHEVKGLLSCVEGVLNNDGCPYCSYQPSLYEKHNFILNTITFYIDYMENLGLPRILTRQELGVLPVGAQYKLIKQWWERNMSEAGVYPTNLY